MPVDIHGCGGLRGGDHGETSGRMASAAIGSSVAEALGAPVRHCAGASDRSSLHEERGVHKTQ